MEPVIDFNNVTKEYPLYHHIGSGIKDLIFHPKRAFQLLKGRKYLAIQDVSFTVGKGEAVALIGRNGAGKSTSLGLRKEVQQRMDRIIEFSELGEFIDEPIRVYSSGMLAKLGFSVISQVEPDILIIDEVLAVGDISFQAKCIKTIKEFKNRGVTILFVSHNMSDVEKICDRVVWIENHRLREIGSAERIIELYKQAMA